MASSVSSALDSLLQSLTSRGWFFSDLDHVKSVITDYSAARGGAFTIDSVEMELCNLDLRSIGGKALPDLVHLRKATSLQPPKVLQIASARDIAKSSAVDGSSNRRRLMKLSLTDGCTEVIAVEYSHIASLPDDVVPGTKIRLEKRAVMHNGIVCLSHDVITVLGGVVESLYEEWHMNKKYSGLARSSLKTVRESDAGGPPAFEKFQIGGPKHGPSRNVSRDIRPTTADSGDSSVVNKSIGKKLTADTDRDSINGEQKMASTSQGTEKSASSSQTRPREAVEHIPLQNQAAAQKLLQRMSHQNQNNQRGRGQRHKGKDKQEEAPVFTLDEWEKRKAGGSLPARVKISNASRDEDLAWQLQNQFDLEDQVQSSRYNDEAEYLKMSMFSFERDEGGVDGRGGYGARGGARGRGSGRGRGGRGRGRGRGRRGGFG